MTTPPTDTRHAEDLTLEALDFPIGHGSTSLRELIITDLSTLGTVERITGSIAETKNHGVIIDDAVAHIRTEGIRIPLKIAVSWDAENKNPVYTNSEGEVLTSLRERYEVDDARVLRESFQRARGAWRQHPAVKAARGQLHRTDEQSRPVENGSELTSLWPFLGAGFTFVTGTITSLGIATQSLATTMIFSVLAALGLLFTLFTGIQLFAGKLEEDSKSPAPEKATDEDLNEWIKNRKEIFQDGFVNQAHTDEFFDAVLTECARLKIEKPRNFRMTGFGAVSIDGLNALPQNVASCNELEIPKAIISDALFCFDGTLGGKSHAFFYNGQAVLRYDEESLSKVIPL